MDDRGSKSVKISYSATVKEQRVNGYRYLQYFCNLFKMYSLELRNKLRSKKKLNNKKFF